MGERGRSSAKVTATATPDGPAKTQQPAVIDDMPDSDSQIAGIGDRISDTDKKEIAKLTIDHLQQHVRAHGSFAGFADFLAQCDQIIAETRAHRSKLMVTRANSLARDVSSIRDASEMLAPEMKALLFRGATTGFLFANLKRDAKAGTRRVRRVLTRKTYRAALAAKPRSRALLAKALGTSLPELRKWEKRHLR
jgi:hypothetical protein